MCAAGGQINVADLQAFNGTAFPALIGLVESLPTLPNQPLILGALVLAQPIVTQVVNSLAATAASASGAFTASAPGAASQ